MGKSTHFFGQPVYGQLIKSLDREKIILPNNVSDKREQRELARSAERRNRRTSEWRAKLARTFLSEEEEDEVKRRRSQQK